MRQRGKFHPRRRVVARALPGARLTVDAHGLDVVFERIGDQGQVDAQAQVAPERGLPLIPPAEHAGLLPPQAEGIVQTE